MDETRRGMMKNYELPNELISFFKYMKNQSQSFLRSAKDHQECIVNTAIKIECENSNSCRESKSLQTLNS